ncbi:MAG TPA: SRPBCC family protein [Chloroflexota bacterium]|nr:SRPBCC family protein [Chloroflexota bacterium]
MPTLRVETLIAASPALCFDLARDVELHTRSAAHSGERAVGGTTSGLLSLGDEVTWKARHLGLWWRLTARIACFEPPHRFVDEQVRGPFHAFTHTHEFLPAAAGAAGGATRMIDTFHYSPPLGPLGWIAGAVFLTRYMQRFLAKRARFLKEEAERRASAERA